MKCIYITDSNLCLLNGFSLAFKKDSFKILSNFSQLLFDTPFNPTINKFCLYVSDKPEIRIKLLPIPLSINSLCKKLCWPSKSSFESFYIFII